LTVFLLLMASRFTCPAADTNAVLDAWFAAQSNLHTWSADFTQTRSLKTLTRPLTAAGHLSVAMPGNFRWEIRQPVPTIALRRGDDMYVIYPELKRAEHYALGANAPREWRDALSLLQAGFPKDRKDFEAQFLVQSVTPTNTTWRLSLQPRSAAARQMLPQLLVDLATNDFSLAATELIFVDGSRMRNDFTNAVVNSAVDPAVFNWQPPADFKVTEPFGK
jgi:outer membrane lipoprotein-sorting protein